MKQPTKEDIDKLQGTTGEGRMWCKRELQGQYALEAIENLHVTGDLAIDNEIKQILKYLLQKS